MRFRCLVAALMFLAAFASDSWGQSQQPPPRQTTDSSQKQPGGEKDATAQSSAVTEIKSHEQAQEKPKTNNDEGNSKRSETWSLSDKIAVIASLVAFLQFLALIATVLVVRRTGQRQLRAYVGVTGRDGMPSLIIGEKQTMGVIIKNHGQTPALKVRYRGEVVIREYPLRAPLKSLSLSETSFPINPDVGRPVVWETNAVLTSAEEKSIRDGTQMFYIYGEVEYFDIFNKRGTATFRYRYGGERLIRMGVGDFCAEGNN